jgi:hypothetical protein
MKRRGHIVTGHDKAEWYTHSTQDVLQKYEIMNGDRKPSEEVLPLLVHGMEKYHPEASKPEFYGGTDVFVVEVASIKIYEAGGWYLQQWCVRDALKGDVKVPEAVALAEDAQLTVQKHEDLVADLMAIVEKLDAPVVFVPHVNVIGANGAPIAERALIRAAIMEVCERTDAKMFDPTPHVYEIGYETAMIDSGHYRPEYELVMGQKLVAFLKENFEHVSYDGAANG